MSAIDSKTFQSLSHKDRFASLRIVKERSEVFSVVRGVAVPPSQEMNLGGMVTVMQDGLMAYAATSDLSVSSVELALEKARGWCSAFKGRGLALLDYEPEHTVGHYTSPTTSNWTSLSNADKWEKLHGYAKVLAADSRVVNSGASFWYSTFESEWMTNGGGRVSQHFNYFAPDLYVVVSDGVDTQSRTLGGRGFCRQGGVELLDGLNLSSRAETQLEEALQLLSAPQAPSAPMDVILMPDQMMLQIHESIGHPLELDRILGDERNYAGTSFVTQEMFGNYRYGSDVLNVSFDPTVEGEFASSGFDDTGTPAKRALLIDHGMLLRPLGSALSGARAKMPSVANARAQHWNRPAIDRMANLNVEPGDTSLSDMIAGVEHGIMMETNRSWSIDDSRNKFQFGCEYARRIQNGKLGEVLKNPNYRGVSATFWRNLSAVGKREHFEVLGTPFCGKGEPNQIIRVGHASPPALFKDIDVFGGVG